MFPYRHGFMKFNNNFFLYRGMTCILKYVRTCVCMYLKRREIKWTDRLRNDEILKKNERLKKFMKDCYEEVRQADGTYCEQPELNNSGEVVDGKQNKERRRLPY